MNDLLAEFAALQACWCHACAATLGEEPRFMVLCPDCGCKRCPKATHHQHVCTRSNEPGQAGSVYGELCARECCHEYREFIEERRREFGL